MNLVNRTFIRVHVDCAGFVQIQGVSAPQVTSRCLLQRWSNLLHLTLYLTQSAENLSCLVPHAA